MNNKELEELKKEFSEKNDFIHSTEKIIWQIRTFETGISPLKLVRPCTIEDGIKIISENEKEHFIKIFQNALDNGRIIKFVPASGAATRMLRKQLSFISRFEKIDYNTLKELAQNGDEDCKAALEFFTNIDRFAFFKKLSDLIEEKGKNISELISERNVTELLHLVTDSDGLNYSNLPKGCILFHSYQEGPRTAFEEHIVEAINYSAGKDKVAKIHFTISPEHESELKKLFNSFLEKYQKAGWKFEVGFSFQSRSTDTVSVTLNNKPFRDENGNILFRTGGHGALLKNLNELKADIISIKNIDNVAPDQLSEQAYKYKKILGGYLISIQKKIFGYLKILEDTSTNDNKLDEIIDIIKMELEFDLSDKLKQKSLEEKKKFLFSFLNRPIRVCGMVKREHHPGGSPFWVLGKDGEITKQIVEPAQMDLSDTKQSKIFNEGTHFNPVDLACAIKDYNGNNFDLEKYSNPETGLITKKSKDGQDLKALELPGLWNGGMYYWITVFVEVPKITFNPVKEVNDLLNPEHQPVAK